MANDFAIIKTGGKQYRVSVGQKLKVEKMEVKAGDTVSFGDVLLTSVAGAIKVGAPRVAGAKVEAKALGAAYGKKVIVFKYHPKTRSRKKKGHTQEYSEVEIVKI